MRKMLLQLICVLAAPTALALSSAPVAAGPIGSFASGAESWTGAHDLNLVKFRRYRNYGYYAPRYTPPPVVYYPPARRLLPAARRLLSGTGRQGIRCAARGL